MFLFIIIFLLLLYFFSGCNENFEDSGYYISVKDLFVNYSDKQYGGQKYNAILRKKKEQKFKIKKSDKGYQISPAGKDHLLMSINRYNGILQFNNYVGFVNKNNLDLKDPISRNRLRSTYWNIDKLPDSEFYQISSVKYPSYFLNLGNTVYFNTKCPVDGVVQFSNRKRSNWKIEPHIN
tara:strand:+ start:585 stop:1121 length:537 start_codon:yes stop_codon:yes gene_type:complete